MGKGIHAFASTKNHVEWIVDSGASKHITRTVSEFDTYHLSMHSKPKTVHTADGISQPIKGTDLVHCTSSFTLSSVYMFPDFQ